MVKRIALIISTAILAFALSACTGGDTQKPVLTKQKAIEGVKLLNPEIEVISVGPSPMEGLFELVVKRGTTISVAYMDPEGKLLFLGNIVNISDKTSLTETRLGELLLIDPKDLPTEGTILMGKADAAMKVFVFSDPECSYCALLHGEMLDAVKEREDISFEIVLVPIIKLHPTAYAKSKAIMCQDTDKKALKMLEDAFIGEELPAPDCDNNIVEENLKLLDKFNISGTPTIVFQDGGRFQGAVHADELIATAEKAAGIEPKQAQPQLQPQAPPKDPADKKNQNTSN